MINKPKFENIHFTGILKNQLFLPTIALIIMLFVNFLLIPSFFDISIKNGVLYGYLIDIINRSSELVILAIGMSLVIASSGGADISVGSVAAISGAVIVRLLGSSYDSYQTPVLIAIFFGVIAGLACGSFNGLLVAKLKIQLMVATLILFTAGRGIAQLVSAREINGILVPGQIIYVRMESYRWIGGFFPHFVVPTPVIIALLFVIISYFVLSKTAMGLYIKTVGINQKAGRLLGLNSTKIIFFCYIFSGLAASLTGLIASSRIYSSDANNIGLNMELDAILAVALGGNSLSGGKFSLFGSVIGALTIQALTTSLYAIGVTADQTPVYKAIVVVVIVALQSEEIKQWRASYRIKAQVKEATR